MQKIITRDRAMLVRTLELARQALKKGSSPIGCIIVDQIGRVISEGHNRSGEAWPKTPRRIGGSGLAHAEMDALFRLSDLEGASQWTLYTSLEPCLMCGGAIGMLGLSRVVWACDDAWGGAGRMIRWNKHPAFEHIKAEGCVYPDLEREAAELFAPEAKKVYPAEGWQRWQGRYPEICHRYADTPEETSALRKVQSEVPKAGVA